MATKNLYNTTCSSCYEKYSTEKCQISLDVNHHICEDCIRRLSVNTVSSRLSISRESYAEVNEVGSGVVELKNLQGKDVDKLKENLCENNHPLCDKHDFTFIYWCKLCKDLICEHNNFAYMFWCQTCQELICLHKSCHELVTEGSLAVLRQSLNQRNTDVLKRSNQSLIEAIDQNKKLENEYNIIDQLYKIVNGVRNGIHENKKRLDLFQCQVERDVNNLKENSRMIQELKTHDLKSVIRFQKIISEVKVNPCTPRPLSPLESLMMTVGRLLEVDVALI